MQPDQLTAQLLAELLGIGAFALLILWQPRHTCRWQHCPHHGKTAREEFTTDYRIYGLAERYLQIAIEACLHVCGILVASLGLRRPEGYHELLSIVAAQHIIPQALAYRLEVLTNLRDALVHDTDTLNRDLLYDHIQQRLGDFEAFVTTVEERQQS